jgi:hypothetical protein
VDYLGHTGEGFVAASPLSLVYEASLRMLLEIELRHLGSLEFQSMKIL